MTNVFAVVGQHRHHPDRLLLLGEDGDFYALAGQSGRLARLTPGGEWEIDRDKVPTAVMAKLASGGQSSGKAAGRQLRFWCHVPTLIVEWFPRLKVH